MWFNEVNNKYGFIGKGKVVAAEDAEEGSGSKFHGKFMAFFGSFHVTLKLHNCRGMMFGNIDQTFYAAWRNTLNKVLWMLFPSDPYQLDCEFPQYILAHYRSAFEYCWEFLGRSNERIPSAADVHKYMLDRAKSSPYRQAILFALRYAEIAKLMKIFQDWRTRVC